MIALISQLFASRTPVLSEATPDDAGAIARLHAATFRRGWSEDEVETLLIDRNVVADRATAGRRLAGFVLARIAADEAEILTIAVDAAARRRGLGRGLLQRNLQRLAARGVRSVFLEVDAANDSALRLYSGMGFVEVGRREGYYGSSAGAPSTALVLRRDIG